MRWLSIVLTVLVVSCASPQQRQAPTASDEQPPLRRTLVLAHRYEPLTLGAKVVAPNGPLTTARLFNASLALFDDKGLARPYLAAALPQLNTDNWRLSPDGTMETTYHLRENLIWQDGVPLTAADFAFALQVYKDPSLGFFISTPQDAIDEALAPDSRTVVLRWKVPNAAAGALSFGDLDPLPRHLLAGPFTAYTQERSSRDSFVSASFWTAEYVGAGPFRLERWDPGVLLEGSAFAEHAHGRPKFDRLQVRIATDENSTFAAVLAGGIVNYTSSNTLYFDHYLQLKRDWEPSVGGTAVLVPAVAEFLFLQQRPEYVGDEALLDLRVRRALAHTIDREGVNDGLFNGLGAPTETPVPPSVSFFSDLDRMMTRYPPDRNRAIQLMGEAGFTRDAEGFFATRQGRRFRLDYLAQTSSSIERMQTILSDSWRRAGFDVRTTVIGVPQYTQQETRHTLPGLGYAYFPSVGERTFVSAEIGTAANRWAGTNRSGWANPGYDRLWDAYSATLDLTERGRYVAQMMALVSEQLPGYAVDFAQQVYTWSASLQGPDIHRQTSGFGQSARTTTNYWNIQDWALR